MALNQRVSQEGIEELVSRFHHSSHNNPDLVLAEICTKKGESTFYKYVCVYYHMLVHSVVWEATYMHCCIKDLVY